MGTESGIVKIRRRLRATISARQQRRNTVSARQTYAARLPFETSYVWIWVYADRPLARAEYVIIPVAGHPEGWSFSETLAEPFSYVPETTVAEWSRLPRKIDLDTGSRDIAIDLAPWKPRTNLTDPIHFEIWFESAPPDLDNAPLYTRGEARG